MATPDQTKKKSAGEGPRRTSGLTKFERIRLVRRLGLNTQDDVLVTSEEDWQRHLKWLKSSKSYTVRSFREGSSSSSVEPYFAVIDAGEFEGHRSSLLDQGWKLIIAKGIDPREALLAGTILRDGLLTEVDVKRGAGSVVRDVTHEGNIDDHFVVQGEELTGDSLVDEALNKIREMEQSRPNLPVLKRVIYEFSYYSTEVGDKGEHVIFWEITGFVRMSDLGIDPQELT